MKSKRPASYMAYAELGWIAVWSSFAIVIIEILAFPFWLVGKIVERNESKRLKK